MKANQTKSRQNQVMKRYQDMVQDVELEFMDKIATFITAAHQEKSNTLHRMNEELQRELQSMNNNKNPDGQCTIRPQLLSIDSIPTSIQSKNCGPEDTSKRDRHCTAQKNDTLTPPHKMALIKAVKQRLNRKRRQKRSRSMIVKQSPDVDLMRNENSIDRAQCREGEEMKTATSNVSKKGTSGRQRFASSLSIQNGYQYHTADIELCPDADKSDTRQRGEIGIKSSNSRSARCWNVEQCRRGSKWVCPKCTFQANCKGNLEKHFKRNNCTNKRVFTLQCDFCPRRFQRKCELIRHQQLSHRKSYKSLFACGKCAKKFKDKTKRNAHSRTCKTRNVSRNA